MERNQPSVGEGMGDEDDEEGGEEGYQMLVMFLKKGEGKEGKKE